MERRPTFRTEAELFHADNCDPLVEAAARGDVQLAALSRNNYPGMRLPPDDLQELCMAGYWDAAAPQAWGLDWHCNEGIEFGFLSAGLLPFAIGSKLMTVEPGCLTITRPWQRHRVGDPNIPSSHYSWIILDVGVRRPNQQWKWPKWLLSQPVYLDRLAEVLSKNEDPVWRANRQIGECFARLDKIVARGADEANHVHLKLIINELIVLLGEFFESSEPHLDESLRGSERTVRLFLDSLSRRLDEPWSLDSMAEECGLGRSQFTTLLRKITNQTPAAYLGKLRLEHAAALLVAEPRLSVTEIAFRCGYQSSQYFARAFRERYAVTPGEWRRRKNGG